jgi:Fe-S-cluster containining protein
MPRETPDCRACGLCCVCNWDQDSFCDLLEEDEKRLGSRILRGKVVRPTPFEQLAAELDGKYVPASIKTHWVEQISGPLKGISTCSCVFLRGSLLKKVFCQVYEKRPRVCRIAVNSGDRTCKIIRKMTENLLRDS